MSDVASTPDSGSSASQSPSAFVSASASSLNSSAISEFLEKYLPDYDVGRMSKLIPSVFSIDDTNGLSFALGVSEEVKKKNTALLAELNTEFQRVKRQEDGKRLAAAILPSASSSQPASSSAVQEGPDGATESTPMLANASGAGGEKVKPHSKRGWYRLVDLLNYAAFAIACVFLGTVAFVGKTALLGVSDIWLTGALGFLALTELTKAILVAVYAPKDEPGKKRSAWLSFAAGILAASMAILATTYHGLLAAGKDTGVLPSIAKAFGTLFGVDFKFAAVQLGFTFVVSILAISAILDWNDERKKPSSHERHLARKSVIALLAIGMAVFLPFGLGVYPTALAQAPLAAYKLASFVIAAFCAVVLGAMKIEDWVSDNRKEAAEAAQFHSDSANSSSFSPTLDDARQNLKVPDQKNDVKAEATVGAQINEWFTSREAKTSAAIKEKINNFINTASSRSELQGLLNRFVSIDGKPTQLGEDLVIAVAERPLDSIEKRRGRFINFMLENVYKHLPVGQRPDFKSIFPPSEIEFGATTTIRHRHHPEHIGASTASGASGNAEVSSTSILNPTHG